jgi:flagellar basal body rod protein FlgG
MIYGLYLSTAGAKAQSQKQDVLANNVANVSTAGFRRQFARLTARADHLTEFGQPAPTEPADPRRMGGGVNLGATPTDLGTPGSYRFTGRPLDLAVKGDGFFQVREGSRTLLVRSGAFRVSAEGDILTDDGRAKLLSKEGNPIRVDPNENVTVDAEGFVIQTGNILAELKLVAPLEPDAVERSAGGLISARTKNAGGRVESGYLEGSNVNPVEELVQLIEASRGFETNVQLIQMQSDGLARLIDSVPRLP